MASSHHPLVITIGRRYGSGGRELGRVLAERLGLAFYDKRLLAQAAEKAGMSSTFFERNDERPPSVWGGIVSGLSRAFVPLYAEVPEYAQGSDSVYGAMSRFIEETATREGCVIVGRTADFILRDHPRCVNIFVHAPLEHCVERIVSRHDCATPERARAMARRINKLRAAYYNFFTDKIWGDSASYDLTLDSSRLTMEEAANVVCAYLRERKMI